MSYQFLRIESVREDGTFVLNDKTILTGNKDEGGTFVTVGVVKFYLQEDQLVAIPSRERPSRE
jgi:hypothetical protein